VLEIFIPYGHLSIARSRVGGTEVPHRRDIRRESAAYELVTQGLRAITPGQTALAGALAAVIRSTRLLATVREKG